jgi:hypothetical protein
LGISSRFVPYFLWFRNMIDMHVNIGLFEVLSSELV